jgi:hypothetical protein
MLKIFKKKSNKKQAESKLFYDDNDALEFIFKETGVDKKTIRKIMNADLRYQKSVGIIDWDDLDDYIDYWTSKYE